MFTNLKIFETLSLDNINAIRIHSTRSSLRRALAVKEFKVVDATETCPKLYYIAIDENTFEVHALSSDLTRYLLLTSVK